MIARKKITKGSFQVSEITPELGIKEAELLSLAAAAEVHSSHPLAEAIRQANRERETENLEVSAKVIDEYQEIAGFGVFGTPAVVVDGDVKSVGKIPKKEEVKTWIGA